MAVRGRRPVLPRGPLTAWSSTLVCPGVCKWICHAMFEKSLRWAGRVVSCIGPFDTQSELLDPLL